MLALEDTFTDVISKAQQGLNINDSELASRANISPEELQLLRSGAINEAALLKIAPVLGLHAESLVCLAQNTWYPAVEPIEGVLQFTSPFSGMLVNSYLVWDQTTREAAAFDTGADARPLLQTIEDQSLILTAIFITHTHRDHIADLNRLSHDGSIPVFSSSKEPVSESSRFDCGARFTVGALTIETRQTWGHSMGGVTYVVRGLARTVAVVGDALFAGSMGGGRVSWMQALATNRSEILTLEDETQICPGHGPMTTVGQEKAHNVFFPEFKA
jgi:hydroxyacylglutathione hydrolase